MSKFRISVATLVVAGLSAASAQAQFNLQWLTLQKDTTRIVNPNGSTATQITTNPDEKDIAKADVNNDGWIDVAIVCKAPQSTLPNKRVGYLMINDNGKLVDRTSQYAVDSDVPGDFGFMTAVANREVEFADVDNDGWVDMITATTLSDGDPKVISHPRIYHNKGAINGIWQGFRYEAARFPQLLTTPGNLAVAPRFCGLAVGDVNGDGFVDLYFADYDDTEAPGNINEPAGHDLNDRLLMNDGAGNFIDSVQTRMTSTQLFSTFAVHAVIKDMNGDGAPDILKDTALTGFFYISTSYNVPANLGNFTTGQFQQNVNGQPYHFDVGDLNNDGRPDLAVGDDGIDYVKYNTGTDGLGRVIWSSNVNYLYVAGSDQGFPGTTVMADMNNDGWLDVIQSDVDVDLGGTGGCSRRMKIFRNPGGTVGSNIQLREEAQQAGSGGWKSAVGMVDADMRGTWDCVAFDLDNDGDLDLIQTRCSGVQVWINQLNAAPTISAFCPGDGTGTACPCGNDSAAGANEGCLDSFGLGGKLILNGIGRVSNDTFKMDGSRMPGGGPALYFEGTAQQAAGAGIAFGDGKLCVGGTLVRLGVKFNTLGGTSSYPVGADPVLSVAGFVAAGDTRTYQIWYRDSAAFCSPSTYNLTNGMQAIWAP